MSSDVSQSILRLTLLASATALFMVVWTGDSARTVGMTLAERNREIVPAHAISRDRSPAQLAQIRSRRVAPQASVAPVQPIKSVPQTAVNAGTQGTEALAAGTYRVVYQDGRVEWMTIIDRSGESRTDAPAVIQTTLNGEAAHLIRVANRGESTVR